MSSNISSQNEDFLSSGPGQLLTPAVLLSKTAHSLVSSTPTSNSIKKSLFGGTQALTEHQQGNGGEHDSPSTLASISTLPCRQSTNSRKQSVRFCVQASTADDLSCFGFDEENTNNNNSGLELGNRKRKRTVSGDYRNRRGHSMANKHSKMDYERQSSLLSFGSLSLSECDDVFGQAPDVPHQQPLNVEPGPSGPERRPSVRSQRLLSGADYTGLSEEFLTAPGFRVSTKVRKQAAHARRIYKAGSTPKRNNAKISEPQLMAPTSTSSVSCLQPKNTSPRKLAHFDQDKGGPSIESHSSETYLRQSPRRHKRPLVVREMERQMLSERDISTCSPTDDDDDNDDYSIPEHLRTPIKSPPTNTRQLFDPARKSLVKVKYNYSVTSPPNKSPSGNDHQRKQIKRSRRNQLFSS